MPFITRTYTALAALVLAIIIISLAWVLAGNSNTGKILFDVGGAMGVFSIQNFMWVAFFIGFGELFYRHQYLASYERSLQQCYLPDDPQILLTPDDMPNIYRSVSGREGELENMIGNLVMRFQAGHSVEQTHEMLNSQLDMWQYRLDIDYNIVRYLTWLIPTLGFLGTVIGIAWTLNAAGSLDINDPDLLMTLTGELGVAFYTTMVALAMSAVLVFIMHIIQGKEERAISDSGQYCLDSLITRLYLMPENRSNNK